MNNIYKQIINYLDDCNLSDKLLVSRPNDWTLVIQIIADIKIELEPPLPEPLLSMQIVNEAIMAGLPVSSPVRAALELIKKAATSLEKK